MAGNFNPSFRSKLVISFLSHFAVTCYAGGGPTKACSSAPACPTVPQTLPRLALLQIAQSFDAADTVFRRTAAENARKYPKSKAYAKYKHGGAKYRCDARVLCVQW